MTRPYPSRFTGRISYLMPRVLRGELVPVYVEDTDIVDHWLVYTEGRETPTMVKTSAVVEPLSVSLQSQAPKGRRTGR